MTFADRGRWHPEAALRGTEALKPPTETNSVNRNTDSVVVSGVHSGESEAAVFERRDRRTPVEGDSSTERFDEDFDEASDAYSDEKIDGLEAVVVKNSPRRAPPMKKTLSAGDSDSDPSS